MLTQHLAKKFERAYVTRVRQIIGKQHFVYKVFCSLTPFSERKWPLQARKHVLSCEPRYNYNVRFFAVHL